jgi:predicted NAD/FAD-binding protein
MSRKTLNIAVIGTGISGLSAAWLLSHRHRVDMFEQRDRIGGHANTVDLYLNGRRTAVDTGFIVYNEPNYPNLVELFRHLDVPTDNSNMSFGVSLDSGRLEYSSAFPTGVFGQLSNLFKPSFWSMLRDIRRFYGSAPDAVQKGRLRGLTLGAYLQQAGYGETFARDHLLPMGAAIWSSQAENMRAYPVEAFVRFFDSHGLLKLRDRPEWRTVRGGSRTYVKKLAEQFPGRLRRGNRIRYISRAPGRVVIQDVTGATHHYDHVVVATHADQALRLLHDPSESERQLLGAMPYTQNRALLHTDPGQMPHRRAVWSSWNYLTTTDVSGTGAAGPPQVSYWMNRLQNLNTSENLFVTLNPANDPPARDILASFAYDHPLFDGAALEAQQNLWSLQGQRNTWFCGSYFGFGFHEDALQSGLAVGEVLGGGARPWTLPDPSSRIHVGPPGRPADLMPHIGMAAE